MTSNTIRSIIFHFVSLDYSKMDNLDETKISAIPTLGDSVAFTTSGKTKTGFRLRWFSAYLPHNMILLDDGPATKEKPPRQVKIQSEVKDSLKIDFDIDLGLLMTSIAKKEDVDEDVTKAWDWDQQFSQLNAEFVTGKSL